MPKDKKKKKIKNGKKSAPVTAGPKVSPLAPASGFPDLAPIEGVRFAAAEAGVRYKGRLDVMLAEVAEGSSIAGVFTRSATRSAPVLWCEDNLAALARDGSDGKGTGDGGSGSKGYADRKSVV